MPKDLNAVCSKSQEETYAAFQLHWALYDPDNATDHITARDRVKVAEIRAI